MRHLSCSSRHVCGLGDEPAAVGRVLPQHVAEDAALLLLIVRPRAFDFVAHFAWDDRQRNQLRMRVIDRRAGGRAMGLAADDGGCGVHRGVAEDNGDARRAADSRNDPVTFVRLRYPLLFRGEFRCLRRLRYLHVHVEHQPIICQLNAGRQTRARRRVTEVVRHGGVR